MALFQRPEDAIEAALAMQDELGRFNDARSDQEPVRIGIGVNTGSVMLGTIGESDRMDGTVIGDVVNVASRLEGLTKKAGEIILISDASRTAIPDRDRFTLETIGQHQLSGKSNAIEVFVVRRGPTDS